MNKHKDGQLLVLIRECINIIHESNAVEKLLNSFEKIQTHVQSTTSGSTTTSQHFSTFLQEILNGSSTTFTNLVLQNDVVFITLKKLLHCTNLSSLFLIYNGCLHQASAINDAKKELVLKLLMDFIQHDLKLMLIQESNVSSASPPFLQDKIISTLCTIPNQVANKTKGKIRPIFHHENFVSCVALNVLYAFEEMIVHSPTQRSVSFLAKLIGKTCITGSIKKFLDTFLPYIINQSNSNTKWSMLVQDVLKHLPEQSIEGIFTETMKILPWYGLARDIFGDMITTNSRVKYIASHKLLLMKWFSDPLIVQNIIGYASTGDPHSVQLMQMLKTLLFAWGDGTSVQYMPYEQHKYISQAIIISVGFIPLDIRQAERQDIISWLMPGMKCHLDSPDHSVRLLGMVVGQTLTNALGKDDTTGQLEFEFTKTEEISALAELIKPPTKPQKALNEMMVKHLNNRNNIMKDMFRDGEDLYRPASATYTTAQVTKSQFVKFNQTDGKKLEAPSQQNYDSDDSDDVEDSTFVAYDLSNDTKKSKVAKPMYVLDCMTAIRETEDREVMEVNFNNAEELIHKDSASAKEVAVEFSKIMLNLQDAFALDNFVAMRYAIMSAVVSSNPIQVSTYLTDQFYGENYNLQHRLDILHVLGSAAGELSRIEKKKSSEIDEEVERLSLEDEESKTWREIVDARIEKKTRRFGKVHLAASKTSTSAQVCPFNEVAGYFFYPLLHGYDKQIRTFDMLGTDSVVLGRLLYTLGSIIYAAANSPQCHIMGKCLLEFCLQFRSHQEAYVRQAALYATSMTILSVPVHLQDEELMILMRMWTGNILQQDNNTKTQEMAAQTVMLIDARAKELLNSVT